MRRVLICLLAAAAVLWSHAVLKDSNPRAHGVVMGPEATLELKFNVRIDASRSRLYLQNGGALRPVRVTAQPSPDTLMSDLTGLSSGDAVLRWQVLAVDGHITRGELPFTVR